MKYPLIPALLLTLLFSACSKPEEESQPAADHSAAEALTEPSSAPDLANSAAGAPEAESSKGGSVNYLPVLLQKIEGAEKIAALQQQVQAVQAIQQQRAGLNAQIRAASDPAKLDELKADLNRAEQAFTQQNDQLIQRYGIDLGSRNEYLFVAQKSEVLVQADADPASADAEAVDRWVRTKSLEGAQVIRQFLNELNQVKQIRVAIAQLEAARSAATDEAAQAELSTKIGEATELYQQRSKRLFEAYGYTLERPSIARNTELNVYVQPPLPKLNQVASVPDDYVFIGRLEGVATNLEFARNLQVVEATSKRARYLAESLAAESDAAKKAELQEELDALAAKIDQNAKAMLEAYKFSNDRNYRQVVTKARLDIELTEAEIAARQAEDSDYTAPENGYEPVIKINNAAANSEFRNNVQVMERLRQQIVQAQQALPNVADAAEKAELQAAIETATKKLSEINAAMAETYKYSLTRKYQYVVEESELYLQLTRAELSEL